MDEIKRQAIAASKLLATLHASNSDSMKIEKVSNTQSRVIQRLLQRLKKTPDIESLQSLSQSILEGAWCEVDKQALADAIATAIEDAGGDESRQEWMVQCLLTAPVQAALAEDQGHDALCQHFLTLGLWCPSEPTYQRMSILLKLATEQEGLGA